jgi:ubiquinol-cytochrome c reductase cytochrome b subunit
VQLAEFKIASKPVLKQIIVPIFDSYPMLTSKHWDYIYFRQCLFANTTQYADLPTYTRPNTLPIPNIDDILCLPYFDGWLVGFIEAEGCFSTFLATKETNFTSSFSIVQKDGLQIMSVIQKRLAFNSKPYLDKNTNCYSLNTTGVRGVQNVIHFLHKTPAKLKGLKRANYLSWLHAIRVNPPYMSVMVPDKY